jgi:hypothetical protein
MRPFLQNLAGGDRRSIGTSNELVAEVLARPVLFRHVLDGIGVADPLIRLRAADAVEKITTRRPDLLQAHKNKILRYAASATEKEVRWHMAALLTRLKLTPRERAIVLDILFDYLRDSSSIVRTFAMQALAAGDTGGDDPH